jgi:hypothetical protein
MTLKHCNGCDTDKELKEFWVRKSGRGAGKPLSQCKECNGVASINWRKANPEKVKTGKQNWNNLNREKTRKHHRDAHYRKGGKSAAKNKLCTAYLGCIISETVLAHEFPGFKRMPNCNPDYDYECPKGLFVDVKSSCRVHRKQGHDYWYFAIKKNKVPHFFICIAWKDRETLVPEHLWLIPGYLVNEKKGIGITPTAKSLSKWSKYERPLGNVLECCNKLRGDEKLDPHTT